MTNARLAEALGQVTRIEEEAHAVYADGRDLPEKDAAQVVRRQAIGLRRNLEQWIEKRALRVAQKQSRHDAPVVGAQLG